MIQNALLKMRFENTELTDELEKALESLELVRNKLNLLIKYFVKTVASLDIK